MEESAILEQINHFRSLKRLGLGDAIWLHMWAKSDPTGEVKRCMLSAASPTLQRDET